MMTLLDEVFTGRRQAVCLRETTRPPKKRPLIFPGSFHPLHKGHLAMAAHAGARFGAVVEFEISVINVEKPPLDRDAVHSRIAQFDPSQPVWITRAPTFQEKARLFPRARFVVGADTIVRIAELRFYDNDRGRRDQTLDELARHDCQFLVYGRLAGERFLTVEQLSLPSALQSRCVGIPESDYRCDLSSTGIRDGTS